MTAFSQIVGSVARRPVAHATLQPTDFAENWPGKPAKSVAVGLLLLSEADIVTCRAEAYKHANELYPGARDDDWTEERNDALMCWSLSLSLCDVNNAAATYFQMQDDECIRDALRPDAIRHLWDELERATIVNSPVRVQATDEELEAVARLIQEGTVDKLVSSQAIRIRKLCAFMLDELVCASEADSPDLADV